MKTKSTGNHPERVALEAYALGRLESRSMRGVEAHLETCAVCRQVVATTPDDRLIRLLRLEKAPSGPLVRPG